VGVCGYHPCAPSPLPAAVEAIHPDRAEHSHCLQSLSLPKTVARPSSILRLMPKARAPRTTAPCVPLAHAILRLRLRLRAATISARRSAPPGASTRGGGARTAGSGCATAAAATSRRRSRSRAARPSRSRGAARRTWAASTRAAACTCGGAAARCVFPHGAAWRGVASFADPQATCA
jgi:hypothetical protein